MTKQIEELRRIGVLEKPATLTPGFFSRMFFDKKERWWRQTNIRLKRVEQVCRNQTFSPHKPYHGTRLLTTQRWAGKSRQFAGVYPPANPFQPTLSTNVLQAENASNNITPVWPIIGSKALRFCNLLGRGDPTQERHVGPSVPRRFFASTPELFQTSHTCLGGYEAFGLFGMASEPQKVGLNTSEITGVSRHTVEFRQEPDESTNRETRFNSKITRKIFDSRSLSSPPTSMPSRPTKF